MNNAGDVFVADYDNNRVVVIRAGATPEVVPLADVERPIWVAVNRGGDLFVSAGNAVVRLPQGR